MRGGAEYMLQYERQCSALPDEMMSRVFATPYLRQEGAGGLQLVLPGVISQQHECQRSPE
jgi:hypothetical protein